MKIRTKHTLLTIMGFGIGFPLGILAIEVNNLFIIPMFVLIIALGSFEFTLKCPRCNKPVIENPVTFFGKEVFRYTPWIPYLCSKCGHKIE